LEEAALPVMRAMFRVDPGLKPYLPGVRV